MARKPKCKHEWELETKRPCHKTCKLCGTKTIYHRYEWIDEGTQKCIYCGYEMERPITGATYGIIRNMIRDFKKRNIAGVTYYIPWEGIVDIRGPKRISMPFTPKEVTKVIALLLDREPNHIRNIVKKEMEEIGN